MVRLLGKLWVNPINIPLRRFAFAARRCPPSKGDVGLAKAIGAGVVFRLHRGYIPLRRFAFATHRCPPSKWDVCLAKAVGGVVVFLRLVTWLCRVTRNADGFAVEGTWAAAEPRNAFLC